MRKVEARWHLRTLLVMKGIFNTTDLLPLLAERGINVSRTQVYRIVTDTPNYISLNMIAALCDILACTPADLIESIPARQRAKKTVGGKGAANDPVGARSLRPVRARINDADKD